jgi:hypothetical protein
MASVTVQLPPETEQKLRHQASLRGQSLEAYLAGLAEREASALNGVPGASPGPPTFEELTGPIARAVQGSGLKPDEADEFLKEAVKERRAERRSSSG